jgi:hypothetical protein
MTCLTIYLLIGLASFWPMLHLDKECRDFVTGSRKHIAMAWALWCVFWLPSVVLDGLFWFSNGGDK